MSETTKVIQVALTEEELFLTACSMAGAIKQFAVMDFPGMSHLQKMFTACMSKASPETRNRIKITVETLGLFIEGNNDMSKSILVTAAKMEEFATRMESISDDVNDLINPLGL